MAWLARQEDAGCGAIGTLRHVAVHWHVESYSIQMRMRNWKTTGE